MFLGICSTSGLCVIVLSSLYSSIEKKVRGLTIQKACFPPSTSIFPPRPLLPTPRSLLFWSHTELLSWSWGPPSFQLLLFPMSLWNDNVIDTAALAVGLGGLPVTGAGGSVPSGGEWGLKALRTVPCCTWSWERDILPTGKAWRIALHGFTASLFFHQVGGDGLGAALSFVLVEQCFFPFKQSTGATFLEMKDEKTVRLPARNI